MKIRYVIFFIIILFPIIQAQECTNGEKRPCLSVQGICAQGFQICFSAIWGPCSIRPFETDFCNNGKDDNCNGIIDENCICEEGAVEPCGIDTGICEQGTRSCLNGDWTACEGGIQPQPEECTNGIDDDCDGFCDSLFSSCSDQSKSGDDDCISLNTCNDRIQNQDEEGIDCGGSCQNPCPSCIDNILNQEEEKVSQLIESEVVQDCGGPNCPPCPTCFDGIKNQDEEGIDCDSSCQPCIEEVVTSSCGNNLCEEAESPQTCPEDCRSGKSMLLLFLFIMLFFGIGSAIFFLYIRASKKKKPKEQQQVKIHPSLLKLPPRNIKLEKTEKELKKIK